MSLFLIDSAVLPSTERSPIPFLPSHRKKINILSIFSSLVDIISSHEHLSFSSYNLKSRSLDTKAVHRGKGTKPGACVR